MVGVGLINDHGGTWFESQCVQIGFTTHVWSQGLDDGWSEDAWDVSREVAHSHNQSRVPE